MSYREDKAATCKCAKKLQMAAVVEPKMGSGHKGREGRQ